MREKTQSSHTRLCSGVGFEPGSTEIKNKKQRKTPLSQLDPQIYCCCLSCLFHRLDILETVTPQREGRSGCLTSQREECFQVGLSFMKALMLSNPHLPVVRYYDPSSLML